MEFCFRVSIFIKSLCASVCPLESENNKLPNYTQWPKMDCSVKSTPFAGDNSQDTHSENVTKLGRFFGVSFDLEEEISEGGGIGDDDCPSKTNGD